MPTDNFTIRQEGSQLVARSAHGSFLAAVDAPTQKRYHKQAEADVRQMAREVVGRVLVAHDKQRESLSYVQAA